MLNPKLKGLYIPQSPQPIPETMERVYDSEEEYYFLRPKTKTKINTKDIIKTKHITKSKTKTEDSIYSKIKFRCEECNEGIKNKIVQTTHSYSHNVKYLEYTEYFDINSSQNMKEFYIVDKAGIYIEDIDEAINNPLEEIKNCYQFCKVKSFKYKITAKCEYQKRTKEEVKTTKIFVNTEYIINNAIYENRELKQWLNFEKEIYEGYGYDLEFLGLITIQINIETTKASIGSYIDLPPISKTLNQY